MQKVCGAVAYAHRNLIIHRDLKPANILVTAEGEPKLLDFGIAKLLDEDSERTKTAVAMTPEYASPEQIRGGPDTTATDIYSLGVLLYELPTGQKPHIKTESTFALTQVILAG
jgi:serine/threonine protein kinase